MNEIVNEPLVKVENPFPLDFPEDRVRVLVPERINKVETGPEKSSFANSSILIAAGMFAVTMSQPMSLKLPLRHFLKAELNVSPPAMASFFAISMLAWYFKPLAGILTDSVPLFGTRRKFYVILGAFLAGALYLLVGVIPRTYLSLLVTLIGVNTMTMVTSSVIGAISVEVGQRYHATGRINSLRSSVVYACRLLSGPLGGFLAMRALGYTALFGSLVALSVIPFAWFLIQEPPIEQKKSKPWIAIKVQFQTLKKSKTLWSAGGLLFLFFICPGFSTPLYYFQTDTLKLSQQFIGTLSLLSGIFGIVGAGIYALLCRRVNLRILLYVSIVISALSALGYLFYGSGTAAAIIESQAGLMGVIAELALFDFATRATPRGSEGLGLGLMMTVRNLSMELSDIFGSWLVDKHHVSFFKLVWVNAGTTALVLFAIPFLPRILIDARDGSP